MGKTGRVNASELLTTLRYAKPGVVEAAPGSRVGRCEAASGSRNACVGCVGTAPRSIESTHPGRISRAGNVATPMGSESGSVGRPQGRRTAPAGAGRPNKPMPVRRKATGPGSLPTAPSGGGLWGTGRIRGLVSRPKGRPRGSGEPVGSTVTTTREPRDKLDAPAAAGVNGPKDDALDWDAVDWRRVEGDARRLRQRIFTASRDGDLRKVRNLQKLMLRSRSNALVAVRRVTEQNAGRATAGIDGMTALGPQSKADLAGWVQRRRAGWDPWPVKRAWVPKSGGRQRPLGIPVLRDRALQAGDLEAAFDRIAHAYLLTQLGSFPARGLVAQWLRAGVIDKGRFAPTLEGTPQGGIISPVLMNIALHGMEQAAGVRYLTAGTHAGETAPGSPVLIRYADDLTCLCHTHEQTAEVKARLAAWLAPRGLSFNEGKTRIVHLLADAPDEHTS